MRTATLFLLLLTAGAAWAQEKDVSALTKLLESKNPEDREEALRGLGEVEGETVSVIIARSLRDRDHAVRDAAIRALAGRSDEASIRALRASLKTFEKDEDLLPVVVFALGESRDAGSAPAVIRLLRKSVTRDARMTRTSIEALGFMRTRDSLEILTELYLQATNPASATHPELADELLQALQALVGVRWMKPATWRNWWRYARQDWESTPLTIDPAAKEFRSDGWRLSIAKPEGKRWAFEKAAGAVVRVTFKGPSEEARFAWVEIRAHAVGEGDPKDRVQLAATWRQWMEEGLSKRKDEQWAVPKRLGRHPALFHRATGVGRGYVATWRTWIIESNGLLYAVTTRVESGANEQVLEETSSVLGSFRLLDE